MLPRTLSDFTGPCRVGGDELCYQVCPVCASNRWKVYVDPITGYWFCFALAHGGGGRVEPDDWTQAARHEMLGLITYGVPALPEWRETILPEYVELSSMALRYLTRRGVHKSTCGTLGIREMARTPRILLPYRGPYGRVIAWTGRHFVESMRKFDEPKYLGAVGAKPPYMLPRWEAVPQAVLVEGPFDAIAVWQATGMPVIAIGGTTMSKRIEHDVRTLVRANVHIMLDADAHAKALQLRDQLSDQYSPHIHMLDDGSDPASVEPELIREMLA